MKALIVEDSQISVEILSFFIKDYFDYEVAYDGEEGFEKIEKSHESKKYYDFVFLDIMMPKKDGHDLLKEIRDYESKTNLKKSKIIMITSLSDFDTVVKSFENKCDDYITKPIDKEKIITVLVRNGIKME